VCYYSVRKGAISRAVSPVYSFLVPLPSFAKKKKGDGDTFETEKEIDRERERERVKKVKEAVRGWGI